MEAEPFVVAGCLGAATALFLYRDRIADKLPGGEALGRGFATRRVVLLAIGLALLGLSILFRDL